MNPRVVLSAMMLFGAAAGWIYYPPPLAGDREMAALAPHQLRDDGRVAKTLLNQDAARRYRDRVIPLGCIVLGLGVLLAGIVRRQPNPETRENENER